MRNRFVSMCKIKSYKECPPATLLLQNLDNYRKWILDSHGADIQREQELFRSSTSIVGSVEFRRGQTMQDGRAVPIRLGRPPKKNRSYLSGKQIVMKSVPNAPNG